MPRKRCSWLGAGWLTCNHSLIDASLIQAHSTPPADLRESGGWKIAIFGTLYSQRGMAVEDGLIGRSWGK